MKNTSTTSMSPAAASLHSEAGRASSLERSTQTLSAAESNPLFKEGSEWLNCGEPAEAARCFERALERSPDFADGHVGLGIAYAIQAKIYPALDHLETAARLEPRNFYAHFKLSQLYFKLRVPQKGYEAASRALASTRSLEERRLVAQLLHEERQREKNGLQRPWWSKPFPRLALLLGGSAVVTLLVVLLAHLR